MENLIGVPQEFSGNDILADIYSYSSPMQISHNTKLQSCRFLFNDQNCFITAPFRLGNQSWRPVPVLSEFNIRALFNDDLVGCPLQISVIPIFSETGELGFQGLAGRGNEYNPNLPPDSFCLLTVGDNKELTLDRISNDFMPLLIDWLRVLSRQWWIGQPSEKKTGHKHFQFQITPDLGIGEVYPSIIQSTANPDCIHISNDIWLESIKRASQLDLPDWDDLIELDILQHHKNHDYRTSILLFCCLVELLRDNFLEKNSIKKNELKVSSTDLLKHITIGFDRVIGRNLKKEKPELFSIIESSWRARGHFGHGKAFSWKHGDILSVRDMPNNFISESISEVKQWFLDL